ncbi:P-loop containing nucleoside triphosphate hydrolase protein [Chaetomium fimeti]|uniref:P-loop containing nucleoside triphosphate hydrolase protein n=1 Tax=Chaetomium fimeti TaxID=1854472 RepID=A0AAE0LVL4_9PEZI|nr:P-loop containing nucleoside triphosphate hydrolase protein [Chaetomium fimeti]
MEEDSEVYVDAAETQHGQGDNGMRNGASHSRLEPPGAVASTGSDDFGMDVDESMETRDVISLSDDDIVIALMGVTGSGKSTFISLLAEQSVRIGHSLNSCTADIEIYSFQYGDRTVYLIDTPGFDDTSRSDTEILKDIAFFLAGIYSQKVRLAGIVYLHRISDPRMQGSALKNLHMFQKLCGDRGLSSVVLATTMWKGLEATEEGRQIGQQRSEDLQKPEFWGGMIKRGSRIVKHDGSPESAKLIVGSLIDAVTTGGTNGEDSRGAVLDIQVQMVDEGKTLDETAAGQFVQAEMLEARRRFEADLVEYQASMEMALQEKDTEMFELLRKEKEDAERRAAQLNADRDKLRVSLQQLAHEKDAKYQALAAEVQAEQTQKNQESNNAAASASPELLQLQRELAAIRRELNENKARHTYDLQRQQMTLEHQLETEVRQERLRAREREVALVQQQAELESRIKVEMRRGRKRGGGNLATSMCQAIVNLVVGGGSQELGGLAYGVLDQGRGRRGRHG